MTLLARRLVQPDYDTGPVWVETLGPAVAELNASIGFAPDAQQEHCLDKIFAIRDDGLSACFEYLVVVCRQNLKTGLFKQTAVGWLFVLEVPWFVWSAHEMSTTLESMREIHTLIADSSLSKMLPATRNAGLYEDNNKTRIELATGQRILFKARTQSGGRGLAAPKLILDELFAARPSHVGSIYPALAAQEDPQIVAGSSAPKADSSVLIDMSDRGRAATSARLGYDEWLAPREPCRDQHGDIDSRCMHPKDAPARGLDCALDRPYLRERANPTLSTGRISMETLDGLRQALPPPEFARECYGWRDAEDVTADVFGGSWAGCASDEDALPPDAIGVSISLDQEWGSIAAATMLDGPEADNQDELDSEDPNDDPVTGTVLIAAQDRRRGTGWLVGEAKRLQTAYDCAVVVDEKEPTGTLVEDLEDARVRVTVLKLPEYASATSRFHRRVKVGPGRLRHVAPSELDDDVKAAAWRMVGDRRLLGRKQSAGDVSLLEGAVLAVHGAEQAPSVYEGRGLMTL